MILGSCVKKKFYYLLKVKVFIPKVMSLKHTVSGAGHDVYFVAFFLINVSFAVGVVVCCKISTKGKCNTVDDRRAGTQAAKVDMVMQ